MFANYSTFSKMVKDAVREEAENVWTFMVDRRIGGTHEQGCIRVSTLALCQEAYEWAGGDEEYDPHDISHALIERTYPILPRADYDAHYLNDESIKELSNLADIKEVSTLAMTAMKTSTLMRMQRFIPDLLLSGFIDEKDIGYQYSEMKAENGYIKLRGAICCVVEYPPESPKAKPKPFCKVYVSVSGAKPDEDLTCAMAPVNDIMQFFANEDFDVTAPVVPT